MGSSAAGKHCNHWSIRCESRCATLNCPWSAFLHIPKTTTTKTAQYKSDKLQACAFSLTTVGLGG